MKTYYYSPTTGEIINTDAPADWMGNTDIAPPVFDAKTQGVFFRDDKWAVITAAVLPGPSPESQIAALEAAQGRAIREATLTGNKTRLQAIDDQIASLRKLFV
jgi:hypothetical protein